jgi:putrescine transport system substrate-binding protein
LAQCGIGILDSPAEILRVILQYLGRSPDAATPQDLNDAEAILRAVRPFIRMISSNLIEPLSNGEICVAVAYNGDVIQARNRARDAKTGVRIGFLLPEEGSLMWADLLAIPQDAPHVANAHLFINYLMDPHVIAKVSNAIGYANANIASIPFIDPSIRSDSAAFPTPDQRRRLVALTENSPEETRAITRLWQKFKTGQ